ncbi:uncharacterized protein LOC110876273 [Helianthus annuus]|uniref:uncharacterized protein LOC110876273 n=1 Tax=Helianthus annuus TaxID=4232 RepID=UPI0016530AE4|nr:uncharacterized protein LOC110876273 [Helianthus annuus]
MENNKITMFSSLNAHSTNYTIKAKIISMWNKKMNGSDNQIYRVDMLLMDEEGSFIQCSCLHKLFKRFLKFLVVDDCLLFHKPSLAKDTTKIKVTGNDQKLSLYAFSSVLKTENWSGPRDQKISLTLWENYAVTLSEYMNDKNRPAHVVILVHFGTVNIYQGKIGLTNMFEASRVFINSDLDEIQEFKDRYLEKEFSNSSSSKQSCSQEKKVIIVGIVIAISNDKPWYYLSCNNCKKQIEEKSTLVEKDDGSFDVLDEKTFECINPNCDAVDVVPVYRYKIPLRVQDSSGTVSCTLFDYEAIKLIKKTSKELLDVYSKVDNSTEGSFQSLPSEFDILINKKFAFQIKISSFNISNQIENYGISMLTFDDDILSALENKWKINDSDMSESNVQCLSDSVGNVKCFSKESQSVIGDSVTPDNFDVNDQDQSKFDNIKRNLQDVYDVDAVQSSSTKRRNSPGNEKVNDAVNLDLITPKLEK